MIRIRLSTILGELRVKQSELARLTGIRPSTISKLYNERTQHINLGDIDKICDALGCSIDELLVSDQCKTIE